MAVRKKASTADPAVAPARAPARGGKARKALAAAPVAAAPPALAAAPVAEAPPALPEPTPAEAAPVVDVPAPARPTHADVARRAYELWLARGGDAFTNWIDAERQLGA